MGPTRTGGRRRTTLGTIDTKGRTQPLCCTGLTRTARIRERDGPPRDYRLDREYRVAVDVEVPARGVTWLVIE